MQWNAVAPSTCVHLNCTVFKASLWAGSEGTVCCGLQQKLKPVDVGEVCLWEHV
jgi:hypothetical protein